MPQQKKSVSLSPFKYSEDWAAVRFTAKYGEAVRFVHNTKRWLYWDGEDWQWDKTLLIQDLIRALCREVAQLAANDPELSGAQRAQTAQRFSSGRIVSGIEFFLKITPVHVYTLPPLLESSEGHPVYPLAPRNGVAL